MHEYWISPQQRHLKYSCCNYKTYRLSIPAMSRANACALFTEIVYDNPNKSLYWERESGFYLYFAVAFNSERNKNASDGQTMLNESAPEGEHCNRCTLVCTLQTRLLGCPSLVRATSGPGHFRLSPEAHYGELPREHQQKKHEEVSLDDTVRKIHAETVRFTQTTTCTLEPTADSSYTRVCCNYKKGMWAQY